MALSDPSELYGLPLERFVPERSALAKALRSAGERERAAEVAAKRKPSLAAWAVNQLVRTQGRTIADLFEAGDQLQRAQAELLAGRADGHTLREAADRQRALVDQLTRRAQGLLSSEGHALSAAMLERVRATLAAAALEPDARALVTEGCLERELHHVGLGAGGLAAEATPPRTRTTTPARRAERERGETLKAARKAAADANRASERAARELSDAEQRRQRAAQVLEDAKARVAEARERVKHAERATEKARQAVIKANR